MSADHRSPQSEGVLPLAVNLFFLLVGFATLFFLLTGGIPLLQWGGENSLDVAVAKKFSMKAVRASVLIFFTVTTFFAWKYRSRFENLWIVRVARKIASFPLRYSVGTLFLIYSAMMILIGFERHAALDTRAFDLGIFAQALWNTTQGDFLYSSLKDGICLLGDHVSPILVLIAPLYAVVSDPRILLVIQPLATASCMFAIAWIARDRFKDKSLVLVFVLMFFFYMPARAALREDFHPEVLAEIFIFLAFIALERGRLGWFWLCVVPVMGAKENFLGITFFMGAYGAIFKKRWFSGFVLMLVSAVLFLFEIRWLVPFLSHAPYFYRGTYEQFSSEPLNRFFAIMSDGGRWQYGLKVYASFLFLPFFNLQTFFLTLPVFLQNFLSANPTMRSLNYHYSSGLTPFLFISAIYGVKTLGDRWSYAKKHQGALVLVMFVVVLTQSAPPEYFYFWRCRMRQTPHAVYVRERLNSVGPGVSVLSHNNFIPQMINRKYIYQLDYNASPTKGELAKKLDVDYVIFDETFWEPNSAPPAVALAELQALGYVIKEEKDGFYILAKRPAAVLSSVS